MKKVLSFFLFCYSLSVVSQDFTPFKIYSKKGKEVVLEDITRDAKKADVVLFGELHNNVMAHYLELHLLMALDSTLETNWVLSLEMLEADNQYIINEYVDGFISTKYYQENVRFWDNYVTDYQPMVDYAMKNDVAVLAANVPRRYASALYKKGLPVLDSLSPLAQQFICPIPFRIDTSETAYVNMKEMSGGHGGENMLYAQMIKDATMAYFIAESLQKNTKVYHVNGAFHSNYYSGVCFYLREYAPKAKLLTLSVVESKDLGFEDDYATLADFIIVVRDDIPTSY